MNLDMTLKWGHTYCRRCIQDVGSTSVGKRFLHRAARTGLCNRRKLAAKPSLRQLVSLCCPCCSFQTWRSVPYTAILRGHFFERDRSPMAFNNVDAQKTDVSGKTSEHQNRQSFELHPIQHAARISASGEGASPGDLLEMVPQPHWWSKWLTAHWLIFIYWQILTTIAIGSSRELRDLRPHWRDDIFVQMMNGWLWILEICLIKKSDTALQRSSRYASTPPKLQTSDVSLILICQCLSWCWLTGQFRQIAGTPWSIPRCAVEVGTNGVMKARSGRLWRLSWMWRPGSWFRWFLVAELEQRFCCLGQGEGTEQWERLLQGQVNSRCEVHGFLS